jgi:hypothetical protein
VEFDPKVAAISALVAFVFSFILGLICGVGFGTVIMRAFMFAFAFFLLGAIFNVVFDKFLANKDDFDSDDMDEKVGRKGANVDLSVGDDVIFSSPVDLDDGEGGAFGNDASAGSDGEREAFYGDANAGLEQNGDIAYNGEQGSSFVADSRNAAQGGAKRDNADMDLSTFIPGMPVSGGMDGANDAMSTGTVEMSVAKRPSKDIKLSDLGKNVDGEKVANAIHTLLKKDEG